MSTPSPLLNEQQPAFLAVGGIWLDQIRSPRLPAVQDVLGGSVTFATIGARLFVQDNPRSIHLVFRAGNDFPYHVLDILRSWNVGLHVHLEAEMPSARGIVQYDGDNGSDRTYERLTSPLLITPEEHLTLSDLLGAKCFHFFATPEQVVGQIDAINKVRHLVHDPHQDRSPLYIWEPQAKACNPNTLDVHMQAYQSVDVFSPNHVELSSLFTKLADHDFDRGRIEKQALHLCRARKTSPSQTHALIVRAAEHGCLVLSCTSSALSMTWLPAYYGSRPSKVIDPTGAGNAFLGAFAIGYQETKNFVEAAMYGQVAASFVIEQLGVPVLQGRGEAETCNGEPVLRRLRQYQASLKKAEERVIDVLGFDVSYVRYV